MRLLRTEADEGFRLVEYVSEIAAPPYAILSHRWGADDEEYTYKDLLEGTGKHKIGYQKVRACGVQAIKDNLDYFWVDTCCIDKSSSAELSEAINSMWLWYCNSEVCYAFLNDVPAEIGHQDRNQVLGRSKWFTRGWTLQELLAPRRVNFYNATWKLIGTKHNMAGIISSITHIGQVYLSDRPDPLETASIAERMSWASRRETKRVEDVTYCLLGIFGVSMPLLYGEGDRAFQRLQEEIMKQSDDQSIFAWEVLPTEYDGSMLARSPNAFSACGNIVRALNSSSTTPYTMTNRGLQIELPLMHRGDGFVARLNCRYKHDFFSDLGVPIRRARKGFQFVRDDDDVSSIALTRWRDSSLHTIYMKTAAKYFGARNDPQQDSVIIRNLPPGYVISSVSASQLGARSFRHQCDFLSGAGRILARKGPGKACLRDRPRNYFHVPHGRTRVPEQESLGGPYTSSVFRRKYRHGTSVLPVAGQKTIDIIKSSVMCAWNILFAGNGHGCSRQKVHGGRHRIK
jgi:hypothetical protein